MKDGLCVKKKEKHLYKKLCILLAGYSRATAPAISGFIMRDCLCASSQACVCASHVRSEKKRDHFLLKKMPGKGHKSPRAPGGTSRKTETLKARQARSSGEERKHQSWNPSRTCSGSCRMLKTRPGSVCVCVPEHAWLFSLCVRVSLCGCVGGFVCVWKHAESFSVCVCVDSSENASQTPLFWGGNGQ